MCWSVPDFEKGRAAFSTRRVEIACVSSLREIRGKCVLARPQNDRRFSGWFRALGIRRALPQVTDGTARGPTQRAPRRRRGEGRLDRIAALEARAAFQTRGETLLFLVLSCGDRRKGSCATSATQESTRPLSSLARSRPTDCRGDRSWFHERRRRTHVEAATAARATVELPGAHCVFFLFCKRMRT